jgi:hypothetical protein
MVGLIAFECSGRVRDAFNCLGHDFYSCDLKDSERPLDTKHLKGDVFEALDPRYDFIGLHPDCTYLCSAGMCQNTAEREEKTRKSVEHVLRLVRWLAENNIKKWYIENPIGVISTAFRQPDQMIHPYMFGHDASKTTCLWLHGLPRLRSTAMIPPSYYVRGKPRWGNQGASGGDRLGKRDRAANRARTYQGIAKAMAAQWGNT